MPGSGGTRRRALIGAAGAGAAVLLVGAGFLAGTQFGGGDTTGLVSSRSGPMGNGNGNGYGPFGLDDGSGPGQLPGGPMPGGGDGDEPMGHGGVSAFVTAGRITAISGSTLTLSTLQGGTATVTTTSSTTVQGTVGGKLSSLTVGQVVFVAGTRANDGSYQATAITARPGHGRGDGDQGSQQGDGGGARPGGQAGGAGSGPGGAGQAAQGQNSGAASGTGGSVQTMT